MASNLASVINDVDLVAVNIDTKQMVAILERLAMRIKEQDDRFHILDAFVHTYVKPALHEEELDAIQTAQRHNNEEVSKLSEAFQTLERAISRFQTDVETRFNDFLITHTTALNVAVREINVASDRRHEFLLGELKELREIREKNQQAIVKEFSDTALRIKYLTSEFQKHCSGQTHDLLELQTAISQLKSMIAAIPLRDIPPPPPPPMRVFTDWPGAVTRGNCATNFLDTFSVGHRAELFICLQK